MWLFFVIPFAIAAGFEISYEDCSLPSFIVCPTDDFPESFPRTLDELANACSGIIKYLECAVREEERCQLYPEYVIEQGNKVLSLTKEVCEEDGIYRAVVVNNLKCIVDFLEQLPSRRTCRYVPKEEEIQSRFEALFELGMGHSENQSQTEHNVKMCLRGVQSVACLAVEFKERCGEDVMDAFVESFGKVLLLLNAEDRYCTDEMVDFLPTAVSLYELEAKNEDNLENNWDLEDDWDVEDDE